MTPDFSAYLREVRALRLPHERGGPENLVVLERVESTNLLAKAVAADYHRECQDLPPALFLAFEQTGGRGRLGRSWSSPAGLGVYATLSMPLPDTAALATLPLLVGVGLCRGLDPHLLPSSRPSLKWPNDVEVAGRKIGGILIESMIQPRACAVAIVGFGVNHGQGRSELPTERATSLRLACGGRAPGVSLARLAWDLVAAVEAELAHLGDVERAVAAYRERSAHRPGDRITARLGPGPEPGPEPTTGTVEGRFAGFDEHGRLRLERDGGGEVVLSAGEVIER